ncbi:hypothetical protein PQR35_35260 [Paraburkholderia sediminicola]|uniref:hypothetical protein n=1 Tax=Paraburkholderia sediminicola TaxID=458836 RepID=UPI0038BBE512
MEREPPSSKKPGTKRCGSGYDQAAPDTAARIGFANGAFEDSIEDGSAVVDEFYPVSDRQDEGDSNSGGVTQTDSPSAGTDSGGRSTLRDKLERKAVLLGGAAA